MDRPRSLLHLQHTKKSVCITGCYQTTDDEEDDENDNEEDDKDGAEEEDDDDDCYHLQIL